MIKKNIIMSTLITSLVTTSLFSAPVFAAESNSTTSTSKKVETSSLSKSNKISQALINKATPYITVKDNKYSLSKEGYSTLNSNEIKIVLDCINNNNATLKDVSKTTTLNKRGNTFVQSIHKKANSSSTMFDTSLAASSEYIHITYTWWGAQIYFSHQSIADLNDFFTIEGIGEAAGLSKFLASNGLKLASKYLGPVSLYGTGVAWCMSKVDKGDGVYLNCVLYVPCTITAA